MDIEYDLFPHLIFHYELVLTTAKAGEHGG
jgi:hypothetical protein